MTRTVLTFRCPGKRLKGRTAQVCGGFMAGYDMSARKTTLLLYCSKCQRFWSAEPGPDGWHLKSQNKILIKFVPTTFTLDRGAY